MSSNAKKLGLGIVTIVGVALIVVSLRSRHSKQSGTATEPEPAAESVAAATPSAAPADTEVQSLKGRLAGEIRARQRAEAEAAALRDKVATAPTNVAVARGMVQEIGKRAGTFLPAMGELQALTGRDPSTLSPDEKRRLLELQRDHAKFLGALPEITAFQDKPEEYGRFFSSMFQQAAGLNDAQAAQIEDYMRQRAMVMNQLGLNSAKEPTDPKLEEAWEERRDQFNEQTATGLKGILPPGAAEKVGFGPELMEFLEMDFDKLNLRPAENKAQ